MDDDDWMLRLAGAISDGVPIRWDAVIKRHPGLTAQINHLKWMENLASAYREMPDSERQESGDRQPDFESR